MEVRPNPTSCEPPLVGFEVDKSKIMNALLDTSEQRRSVLHIVGPRGVGKTYLAKEIYTSAEVQRHFDVHVWLPVPYYEWLAKRAIKHMRQQLSIEDEADISNFLRGKRYCVVVDDLNYDYSWSIMAWSVILKELPVNNNGSRVLVTGRPKDGEVCWDPDYISHLHYIVCPRSNKESLEMLHKAAFAKDPWEGCPAGEVDGLKMKFVRKCKGLPWPLRFLGGLLSEHPWNEVLCIIQAIEAAGMSFVKFSTSYRDLSSHDHRTTFLYFLTFPEGAEINRKYLSLMLETERKGLLLGNETLEDLAERSMIEVTKRYSDNSIKCCRLNALFRCLAIHEAKEKRLVWANHSFIVDLFDANIHEYYVVKKNHNYGGKSMDVAQLADASCIFNFGENFPLETALVSDRVLEIDDTVNKTNVATEVKKRGELKYLDRIWSGVTSVLASDTLQHLNGPPSTADLGMLNTLETIQGSNVPPRIIDVSTCPSYHKSLTELWVRGSYSPFSLSSIEMPPRLITLALENLEFHEDPMPTLGKLQHLRILRLRWLLYNAQTGKMICSNGELPLLEKMQLTQIIGLEELSVKEGALPKIKDVVVESCIDLKDLSVPFSILADTPKGVTPACFANWTYKKVL
ncbi:hypothetical protein LUZ61_008940 [Rhynchospora tenuis]|uniref:NB-ARC domain-containing protein n=1 Tax=Rhynchospora tenuis TaxID=198213 RepID=A0AAD6EY37_9POAL|nr:hypothetical protein LUZ61_008940 [Rhynchospora tenuis]